MKKNIVLNDTSTELEGLSGLTMQFTFQVEFVKLLVLDEILGCALGEYSSFKSSFEESKSGTSSSSNFF